MDAADYLLESAGKNPSLSEEIGDAREMAVMTETKGWQILCKRIASQGHRAFDGITHRLRIGHDVEKTEIAYWRGFLDALERLADHPEQTTKNLELAARAAYIAAESLAAKAIEGDDSPYLD